MATITQDAGNLLATKPELTDEAMNQIPSSRAERSADIEHVDTGIFVRLSSLPLEVDHILKRVKSPEAGAIVTFLGTTRNTFQSRQVVHLEYMSYAPLALKTMADIASSIKHKHGLQGIAIVHRLGTVPIGEESVLIAVSSPHRQAAWRAGEEALEEVKKRVEIWKYEKFADGGEWRANNQNHKA